VNRACKDADIPGGSDIYRKNDTTGAVDVLSGSMIPMDSFIFPPSMAESDSATNEIETVQL